MSRGRQLLLHPSAGNQPDNLLFRGNQLIESRGCPRIIRQVNSSVCH